MNSGNWKPSGLPVVCRGCPLLCDDVTVEWRSSGELEFQSVCAEGEQWYTAASTQPVDPAPRLLGNNASLDECAAWLAQSLQTSPATLFLGLESLALHEQQALSEIALASGGWLGLASEHRNPASQLALQQTGLVTGSLGELRRPGTLILLWGEAAERLPQRMAERFFAQALSITAVAGGEADRIADRITKRITKRIAGPTAGSGCRLPLDFIGCEPGQQTDLLRWLRALAAGVAGPGDLPEEWRQLATRVEQAERIVVLSLVPGTAHGGPDPVVDALHEWIRLLNRKRVALLLELPERADNLLSARSLLAWSTGWSGGGMVREGKLAAGSTVASNHELLVRGEYQLAVVAGGSAALDPAAEQALLKRGARRLVWLSGEPSALADSAELVLPIRQFGWDGSGDFQRLDELLIPVNPVVQSERIDAARFLKTVLSLMAPE